MLLLRAATVAPSLDYLVKIVLAVALLSFAPSMAVANGWVVKKATGTVYLVAPGVKAFRAKSGMPLQPGYTVATRGRSRALIARGAETIFVGPNTKFVISKYRSTASKTTLLQTEGHLQVDVQRRARPHFTVETPFLAAIVKGTKFDIRVDRESTTVQVERGLVNVNDFSSGDRADIGAGQAAQTRPQDKVGLRVAGPTLPKVVRGNKRAPVFQTPQIPTIPQASVPQNPQASLGGSLASARNSYERGNGGDSSSSRNSGSERDNRSSSASVSSSGGNSAGGTNGSGDTSGTGGDESTGGGGSSGGSGDSGGSGGSGDSGDSGGGGDDDDDDDDD